MQGSAVLARPVGAIEPQREPASRKIVPIRKRFLEKKTVLVVDSSEAGFFMLRRAFAEAKAPHMLRRAADGAEALAYVKGQERFGDRQRFPFPDLIIAERAVPKVAGLEILDHVRRELGLAIPFILFAASIELKEMRQVTELGWAEYHIRPASLSVLAELVLSIEQTWLEKAAE